MRILVIDDSRTNRDAAVVQLAGHDLIMAATYDEGADHFKVRYDDANVKRLLAERGFIKKEGWDAGYYAAERVAMRESVIPCGFDAVLVDLLMPASENAQGSNGAPYVGQEMPVGIFLALLAAKSGVKHVALFTDSDHHSHPASACFDAFNPNGEDTPTPLHVEGADVLLCNNRNWIGHFKPDDFCQQVECWWEGNEPSVAAKDWLSLLNYLIGESATD